MKKILLLSLFVTVIVQTNYSQTTRRSKRHELKAKNFCKEVDTCLNIPANVVFLPCDDARRRIEHPVLPGIVFIYPTADDINKWMLLWSKGLKGIAIPY